MAEEIKKIDSRDYPFEYPFQYERRKRDKEAIDILYRILRPLALEGLPVYRELMNEDKNSIPDSYVLIVSDITDSGRIYGDGRAQLRISNCDVHLISKGTAKNAGDLHNKNKIKVAAKLREADLDFQGYNLGYNNSMNYTEYTWSVDILHG